MLKILHTILFVGCENSDGLMGFYYSHDGYWNDGKIYQGSKTKIECANTCLDGCIAISSSDKPDSAPCYHYSNRSDLVSRNEDITYLSKAYIKCLGTNV